MNIKETPSIQEYFELALIVVWSILVCSPIILTYYFAHFLFSII